MILEPSPGSVVLDRDGLAWQRSASPTDGTKHWYSSDWHECGETWDAIWRDCGPLRIIWNPAARPGRPPKCVVAGDALLALLEESER